VPSQVVLPTLGQHTKELKKNGLKTNPPNFSRFGAPTQASSSGHLHLAEARSQNHEMEDKVGVIGTQEFFNLLISLRASYVYCFFVFFNLERERWVSFMTLWWHNDAGYAVVDLRGQDDWHSGPRLDMAQPFWPRHAQGEKEEKEEKEERKEEEEPMEEWVDELGFSSKDRVLLFDSVGEGICPVSPTSATEGTATTTSTLVVPVELQNRVRWFSRSAEVREVLLLNGGLKAFVARYGFLAADGHALDPELGSHFYPSHVGQQTPLLLSALSGGPCSNEQFGGDRYGTCPSRRRRSMGAGEHCFSPPRWLHGIVRLSMTSIFDTSSTPHVR